MRGLALAIAIGAAATPAVAAARGDDRAELASLEKRWAKAVVENDRRTLDAIIAPDWSNQGPYGLRTGTSAMFASMAERRERTSSMAIHDLRIRVLGPIAVVQGVEDETSVHGGRDTSGRYTFLDVFERRGGRWKAIATQPTFVARTPQARLPGGRAPAHRQPGRPPSS